MPFIYVTMVTENLSLVFSKQRLFMIFKLTRMAYKRQIIKFCIICKLTSIFLFCIIFSCLIGCTGWYLCSRMCAWNRLLQNKIISIYTRRNRCYNERGSRSNYVRSSIPHCTSKSAFCYINLILLLVFKVLKQFIIGL
jgi:hypothetical protein